MYLDLNGENTSVTPAPIFTNSGMYTKNVEKVMTNEEIVMRLEAALYDKDWAAIELLLEDIQVDAYEIEDFDEEID